ncbi:MAG TPA: hypothetical protein VFO85_07355, partial [Vicinamibacteria bacterium]|nr:hypothetical protein [Vicinamibacteria bacterium]
MESTALARRARSAALPTWLRPRLFLRPWLWVAAALLGLVAAELWVRALDARRGYGPQARTAWYWMFEQDPFL